MIRSYIKNILLLSSFTFSVFYLIDVSANENFRLSIKRARKQGQIVYDSTKVDVLFSIPEICENPKFKIVKQKEKILLDYYFVSLVVKKTTECIANLKIMYEKGNVIPTKNVTTSLLVNKSSIVVFGTPNKFRNELKTEDDFEDDIPEEKTAHDRWLEVLKQSGKYKTNDSKEHKYVQKVLYEYLSALGKADPQNSDEARTALLLKGQTDLIKAIRFTGFIAAENSEDAVKDVAKDYSDDSASVEETFEKYKEVISLQAKDDGGAVIVGSLKPFIGGTTSTIDITLETPIELLHNGETNLVASAEHTTRLKFNPTHKIELSTFYKFCDSDTEFALGRNSQINNCTGNNNLGASSSFILYRDLDGRSIKFTTGVYKDVKSDGGSFNIGPDEGANASISVIF